MKDRKKIIDKIKGKKSKVSNYILDDTIISEDPFDIFYNNSPMTCQNIRESDEDILECVDDVEMSECSSVNKMEASLENKVKDISRNVVDLSTVNNSCIENEVNPISINEVDLSNANKIKSIVLQAKSIPRNEVDLSNANNSCIENKVDYSVVNLDNHSINYTQDEDFLAALIKPKEVVQNSTLLDPQIINQVVIYTSSDLSFKPVSMYKYPHNVDIKYEDGTLFESIYRLFISSLLKIYNSRKDFIVKYRNEVLVFKKDVLKATLGLKRLLDSNDIEYEKSDELIITDVNISLVIDYLLNEPLTSSYVIPLIMSKSRFINGIYYEINLKKSKRAIKDNENIVYEYTLEGPIYNIEYKKYFDYKHKLT